MAKNGRRGQNFEKMVGVYESGRGVYEIARGSTFGKMVGGIQSGRGVYESGRGKHLR